MLTKTSQVEGVVDGPVTMSCEASGTPAPKYEFNKVHHVLITFWKLPACGSGFGNFLKDSLILRNRVIFFYVKANPTLMKVLLQTFLRTSGVVTNTPK